MTAEMATSYLVETDDVFALANPIQNDVAGVLLSLRELSAEGGSPDALNEKLCSMHGFCLLPERVRDKLVRDAPNWCAKAPDEFKWGIANIWSKVPFNVKREVNNVFQYVHLARVCSATIFIKILKGVNDLAASANVTWTKNWKWLTNWHTVLGVWGIHTTDPSEVLADAENMLAAKQHGPDWDVRFSDAVDEVLSAWKVQPRRYAMSYDEFVLSRIWATSGSHSRTLKAVPYMKTKIAVALLMNDADLLRLSRDTSVKANVHVMNFKNEKVYRTVPRHVVNGSMPVYLMMSWIMYLLHNCARSATCPAMGGSLEHIFELLLYASELASDDSEKYDTTEDSTSIRTMLYKCAKLGGAATGNDASPVVEMLFKIMDGLIVDVQGVMLRWECSMLSGWAVTSVLNSLFNMARYRVCSDDVKCAVSHNAAVLGDDFIADSDSYGSTIARWIVMRARGFQVKASSSFTGKLGEFCRYVLDTTQHCVTGYPIRAGGSLTWRQDPQIKPATTLTKINEIVATYTMLESRGCDRDVCQTDMLRELSNITKRSKSEMRQWVTTPRSLGGGGRLDIDVTLNEYNTDYGTVKTRGDVHFEGIADDVVKRVPTKQLRTFLEQKLVWKARGAYIVRRGDFQSPRPYAFNKNQTRPTMAVDITARFNQMECQTLFWTPVLDEMIACGEWSRIREYLEPSSQAVYDKLVKKASKRVIAYWLTGHLTPCTPILPAINPNQLLQFSHDDFSRRFGTLVNYKHHINFSDVQNALLATELACIEYKPQFAWTH